MSSCPELWDDLNLTELVHRAREENLNAHHGLGREILIEIIEGVEYDLPDRPVDKTRLHVMAFINERWDQVRPFVRCPAVSRHPRACFQCSDIQAAKCAFTNHTIIFPNNNEEE